MLLRSRLKKGFRSTWHDDGYNARRNLELMGCRQSFECKNCDTKSNVEGDLNIHEETTHGDIYSSDSSEEVIAKSDHDNHEYVAI